MTAAAIVAALATVEALMKLIPEWIANAKAKGELTADEEREFQARQRMVFSQPYAQPESNATKPDA